MNKKETHQTEDKFAPKQAKNAEMERVSDSRFNKDIEALIRESEDMRIERMMQQRRRGFMAMNMSIVCSILGVGAAGWFFLMQGQLLLCVLSVLISIVPSIFFHIWAQKPIKRYQQEHKTIFMPKLAKTLNGLEFFPERGVSSKIINKLAVVPAHDIYKAEDCFMGQYKGVKVIFSEARLYRKDNKDDPVFQGIFVLLETPNEVFEGHTIITANHKMVKNYEKTRWKSLKPVHVAVSNPAWDKFSIFSNSPDSAELFIGDRLLKELAEASDIFDNAPLTAVLFGKKNVFMMIPNKHDMFEASNLFVPVATKEQAMRTKREIEQLIEIIDVFDLYEPIKT